MQKYTKKNQPEVGIYIKLDEDYQIPPDVL